MVWQKRYSSSSVNVVYAAAASFANVPTSPVHPPLRSCCTLPPFSFPLNT